MFDRRQQQAKKTSLFSWHLKHGARMRKTDGWLLPARYRTGLEIEHRAVRTSAGLFDISHHGLIVVRGKKSEHFLNHYLSADVLSMNDFDVKFNLLLNPRGGIIDGVYIYRFPEYWFLSTNPANSASVLFWLQDNLPASGVEMTDVSEEFSLIALQGPDSGRLLHSVLNKRNLPKPRTAELCRHDDISFRISRTGYSGEDGFEFIVPRGDTQTLWELILETGEKKGIRVLPSGTAARESLRFEAGFPGYGKEMDLFITPAESGLGGYCDFSKDFIGKNVLVRQMSKGVKVKLVTIELKKRKLPRHNARIVDDNGAVIGHVVSAVYSPWSGKFYCNGFVTRSYAKPGNQVNVEFGKRIRPGLIIERPLYKGHNTRSKR